MIDLQERSGTVVFSVRVQPRARRNEVVGEFQGALKLRLTAPPVDDRANDACRRLLADYLNLPLAAVRILAGERSRTKRIEIRGSSAQRIRELCAAPPAT